MAAGPHSPYLHKPYNSYIADFVNWQAQSVYFYDPAGNIVECIARTQRHIRDHESFGPRHFLSVSEIGLVFPASRVQEQCRQITSRYQLPYYNRQPPLLHFAAIGDDEGLFIVVPEKRNWFPTQKAAGIYPVKVICEHNSTLHQWQAS